MIRFVMALLVSSLLCVTAAEGGQYNQVLSIGDEAPAWKDLPGVDGEQHSLAQPGDQLQAAGELLADGVHP